MTLDPREQTTESPAGAETCPACGEASEPGVRFCEACGYELDAATIMRPRLSPAPAVEGGTGPSRLLWIVVAIIWAVIAVLALAWVYGSAWQVG